MELKLPPAKVELLIDDSIEQSVSERVDEVADELPWGCLSKDGDGVVLVGVMALSTFVDNTDERLIRIIPICNSCSPEVQVGIRERRQCSIRPMIRMAVHHTPSPVQLFDDDNSRQRVGQGKGGKGPAKIRHGLQFFGYTIRAADDQGPMLAFAHPGLELLAQLFRG